LANQVTGDEFKAGKLTVIIAGFVDAESTEVWTADALAKKSSNANKQCIGGSI
jgi:hypothetical protein